MRQDAAIALLKDLRDDIQKAVSKDRDLEVSEADVEVLDEIIEMLEVDV